MYNFRIAPWGIIKTECNEKVGLYIRCKLSFYRKQEKWFIVPLYYRCIELNCTGRTDGKISNEIIINIIIKQLTKCNKIKSW